MKYFQKISSDSTGFTLIEVAIVIVVIGLLLGGILIGRDLIDTAQSRRMVSALEQIDTAINTFRLKYNCLPGDCTNAVELGLAAASYANFGYFPNGNADGIIQLDREPFIFVNLVNAGLLNAEFLPYAGYAANDYRNFQRIKMSIPQSFAEYRWGNFGASLNGVSYPSYLLICPNGYMGCLTPTQAFYIDSKIDDGKPVSGTTFAFSQDISNMPLDPPTADIISGFIGQRLYACINDAGLNEPAYLLNSVSPACLLAKADRALRINY